MTAKSLDPSYKMDLDFFTVYHITKSEKTGLEILDWYQTNKYDTRVLPDFNLTLSNITVYLIYKTNMAFHYKLAT